ncbi:uncharacterized protein LOC132275253 isoform X2 [Cornus florida]|uniref:uncharacterized protein LOC132275253 isoform X2 n=1 Tax=Cornus florida TaxID=4283 RepID=UPI00289A7F1F|nr:uncharacterized protein LOC132275253 isoform X2 [Cornus florida]
MESSSSRRSLQNTHTYKQSQKFVSKRIAQAIRGKSCPICLRHIDDRKASVITVCMHAFCIDCIRKWSDLKRKCPLCNAEFDSWFFKINLSSRTFQKEQLPALNEGKNVNLRYERNRRREPLAEQRLIRRSREEFSTGSWRTRPCPRRRSFGRSGSVPPDVGAERVLQWRASIYERHLQAVPFSSSYRLGQNIAGNNGVKERIFERIEPWIRRELQALLRDTDSSVIVHVAASLFISSLEKRQCLPEESGVDDNFLSPLQPFLHERTNMFWHELRCFAESPFTMETYDTVVEYRV